MLKITKRKMTSEEQTLVGQMLEDTPAGGYTDEIEEMQATATRVVIVKPETAEEQSASYIEVEPGQLLFLRGDYSAKEITIARYAPLGIALTIQYSHSLTPAVAYNDAWLKRDLPGDGDLINQPFELLCEELQIPLDAIPAPELSTSTFSASPDSIHPALQPLLHSESQAVNNWKLVFVVLILGLLGYAFYQLRDSFSDAFIIDKVLAVACIPLLLVIGYRFWQSCYSNAAVFSQQKQLLTSLQLGSDTLNSSLPQPAFVKIRYLLTGFRSGRSVRQQRAFNASLPEEFADKHKIPSGFAIYPPAEGYRELIEEIDRSSPRVQGITTHVLLEENADVYLGKLGMVVIRTSKGYLVRRMD